MKKVVEMRTETDIWLDEAETDDDLTSLREAATEIAARMREFSSVTDVRSTVTRGNPEPIIAGIVAEPVVMALAALLPLTAATLMEPSTAACGRAWGESPAILEATFRIESTQPKA